MPYSHAELIEMAEIEAAHRNEGPPQTRADVERLTGYAYYGPDPRAIGHTYTVRVQHTPLNTDDNR